MLDIRQLIYRQEKLITKNQCAYFIDFFEKHVDKSTTEGSTKYKVEEEIKMSALAQVLMQALYPN